MEVFSMVASFVVLYRGPSVSEAKLVGVSSDRELVQQVAKKLLGEARAEEEDDPVIVLIMEGRRRALRRIVREVKP